jgi:hypothetical protein
MSYALLVKFNKNFSNKSNSYPKTGVAVFQKKG